MRKDGEAAHLPNLRGLLRIPTPAQKIIAIRKMIGNDNLVHNTVFVEFRRIAKPVQARERLWKRSSIRCAVIIVPMVVRITWRPCFSFVTLWERQSRPHTPCGRCAVRYLQHRDFSTGPVDVLKPLSVTGKQQACVLKALLCEPWQAGVVPVFPTPYAIPSTHTIVVSTTMICPHPEGNILNGAAFPDLRRVRLWKKSCIKSLSHPRRRPSAIFLEN